MFLLSVTTQILRMSYIPQDLLRLKIEERCTLIFNVIRFFSEKIAHWVFQIIYKDVCHNFLRAHSLSKKKSSFTHIDVIKGVMIHQKSNLYATCHMGQNDMFVYEKFSMPFWHITRPSYMTLKMLVRIFFVSKNSF